MERRVKKLGHRKVCPFKSLTLYYACLLFPCILDTNTTVMRQLLPENWFTLEFMRLLWTVITPTCSAMIIVCPIQSTTIILTVALILLLTTTTSRRGQFFMSLYQLLMSQLNFIEPIIITTISHIIGKCLHPTTTTRWLRTFTPRDAATDSRWKAIILLTLLMRLIRTSTRRWERGSFSNSREGSLKRHEFCSRF